MTLYENVSSWTDVFFQQYVDFYPLEAGLSPVSKSGFPALTKHRHPKYRLIPLRLNSSDRIFQSSELPPV